MTYTKYHPHPFNPDLCTLDTCPMEYAFLSYRPTLIGNSIYLALFAVLLFFQIWLGIKYRIWGFLCAFFCGIVLEIIGYAGRLTMYYNPFPLNNFLLYFIPLSIGPAFLSGGVYLCLSRQIIASNVDVSRLAPRTYTITFICCDFISLLLQAVGGALTSVAETEADRDIGVNVMISGLAFQVFSIVLFLVLWAEYGIRLRRVPVSERNPAFADVRASFRYRAFRFALVASMLLIFTRCVFRVAELHAGFGGKVANDEVAFMILEGPMILLSVAVLTVFHPGFAFWGRWQEAGWSLRGRDVRASGTKGEKRATGRRSLNV